jgi:hypothetical protein
MSEVKHCNAYKQPKFERVSNISVYSSGAAVSLRTVIGEVKRRMNREQDPAIRYAYAVVGLELNKMLLDTV